MKSSKSGKNWWLYVYEHINTNYKPHFHESLCICAVEQGEVIYSYKGRDITLKPREIFIIEPYAIHCIKTFKNILNYHILHIDLDLHIKEYLINDVLLYEMFLKKDIESLLKKLYSNLLYEHKQNYYEEANIDKVKHYIDKNFTKNITLKNLAKFANLNESYLSRSFKKRYGLSPLRYIISKKVQLSKEFLDKGKNISDIALDLGFFDQAHFYKAFKSIYLLTPKEYQKVKNLQD